MGVTNFDNLPQNIVQTRLREIRQVEREQKGSMQRTTGNNLRYFTIDSPGEFAWSGRLPSDSSSFSLKYEHFDIVLTSKTQVVPLADVAIILYTSSDGVNWVEAPHYINYSNPSDRSINYFLTEMKGSATSDFKSRWTLTMGALESTWLAFKVQALATDEVAMSIVRTT